jgi:hypothetical protein
MLPNSQELTGIGIRQEFKNRFVVLYEAIPCDKGEFVVELPIGAVIEGICRRV